MSPGIPDLREVLDALQEGLQIVGPDFTYRYVNHVAAEQGRRTPEEMIGRTMIELNPGVEDTEMFGHIQRILAEGGLHRMEHLVAFPDGSSRCFELCITRATEGVVILSLDITERKRVAAGTRRIQRMEAVGQLAGGVAHDFNNLLTVIQTSASFLKEEVPRGGTAEADLNTILGAVTTASQLTHKLLTFARQMPVAARAIDVGESIENALMLLRRVIGGSVRLETDIQDGVGCIFVDPTALDQILINLAVNARDAMPAGGTLTISPRRRELAQDGEIEGGAALLPGSYAEISVRDTGTGMAPEIIEHIFEPFFTTKSEDRGTGLGLPTCWGLVAQTGGTITVHSQPDSGTTFRIFLPAYIPAERQVPATRSQPPALCSAASVLVVEDQPELHVLIARVLRPLGFCVIEANNADEAIEILERGAARVDLMLSDVVMPGTSGLELATFVRDRYPDIRILLMSGFGGAKQWEGASAELLTKPFTPKLLLSAVERALKH